MPLTPEAFQAFNQNPQIATQLFRSLLGQVSATPTSAQTIQSLARNPNSLAQAFSRLGGVQNFSVGVPAIPIPQQGENFQQAVQRVYQPSILERLILSLFR